MVTNENFQRKAVVIWKHTVHSSQYKDQSFSRLAEDGYWTTTLELQVTLPYGLLRQHLQGPSNATVHSLYVINIFSRPMSQQVELPTTTYPVFWTSVLWMGLYFIHTSASHATESPSVADFALALLLAAAAASESPPYFDSLPTRPSFSSSAVAGVACNRTTRRRLMFLRPF